MMIIRETFTAKPGMASKLAAKMKEVLGSMGKLKSRVLTDAVGQFNTVVLETEIESLAEFEMHIKEYMDSKEIQEKMKGYGDMYLTGRREIYKVV